MNTSRAAILTCGREGAMEIYDPQLEQHPFVQPHPHALATGFAACDQTEIVACSDENATLMAEFGMKYSVPPERQYTDYRELIDKEKPDIVSMTRDPGPRTDIMIYAADHGVKAIYFDNPMAASMADANAMVEAAERNGVVFNIGTNRRFYRGFEVMKEVVANGDLGPLKYMSMQHSGPLFAHCSHTVDLTLYLNGDRPVAWVQAHIPDLSEAMKDGVLISEPQEAQAIAQFEDGVTAHIMCTRHNSEYQAVCKFGTVTATNDFRDLKIVKKSEGGRTPVVIEVPTFEPLSPMTTIVEDLVIALETGEQTRAGVRVARTEMEMLFGFVESHLRGGARVELPLRDSKLRVPRPARPSIPGHGTDW